MKAFLNAVLLFVITINPVDGVHAAAENAPGPFQVQKVFPRTEIPWTSISMAVPRLDVHASLLPLVAALIMEPTAWSKGHIRQLIEFGGHFKATPHPDGIVITAEGPSHNWDILLAAVHEPLAHLSTDVFAFSRAQGRVLRINTENRGNFHHLARVRLWETWFGKDVPPRAIELDDLQMHQISMGTVHEAWDTMVAGNQGGLFLEGRLPDAYAHPDSNSADAGVSSHQSRALDAPIAPTRSTSESQTGSGSSRTLRARPIAHGAPNLLRIPGPVSHLVLGHPLPVTIGGTAEDHWLLAAEIQAQLSDFGDVVVEVDSHADASLLIIDVKADPSEDLQLLRENIQKRLNQERANMGSPARYQAARSQHQQRKAKMLRQFGAHARHSAVCYLKHCAPESSERNAATQKTRLRALIFPEIFRHVILQAGPPLPRPEPYGPKQK